MGISSFTSSRDVNALLDAAEGQGCVIVIGRKSIKITRPGYTTQLTCARTPSDRRAVRNVAALLRRVLEIKL